jgi:hypothetical protein
MTCISLDLVFDLAILCDTSMPLFHTYLKLHIKPLEVGWKEGKRQKPLVRTLHIEWSSESFWGAKAKFHIFKNKQNPSFWAKCSKVIWILTVLLSNHSRFYGRHSECSQVQVRFGITCMQISESRRWTSLVLSTLLEDEQRTKCGGACWQSLTTIYHQHLYKIHQKQHQTKK